MARIIRMNSDQRPVAPEWKDAEDRQASNGYLVLLGWLGVELVGYAVLVLSASDEAPLGCTGLCFSPQDFLVLLGMMFGLPILIGQLIVGMLLTAAANRNEWGSFAAGSAAFFTTFLVVAVIAGGYLGSTR
jgi:hypothetical protein